MGKLIIRLVINAIALWVTSQVVIGIHVVDNLGSLFIVALIFGVINALIKPIVRFFTCPFYIITLGLFTFVVNGLMLMLTGYLSGGRLGVDGFVPAFLGGIVISIVSTLLSLFLSDDD
ncbi:MAG: phage holin family protein [Caldilineaceae bacterium]